MRFSDFLLGGTIYGVGTVWSFALSRQMSSVMQRLLTYHVFSHMFFMVSLAAVITVPYRRLTGFWDNGMRWKKPENKLNKYDMTSHFEKATGWSRFRANIDA
mmetsp:Transcript_28078/g.42467  ORF Transcript_28078/g.42467 Transcript_28078/m.42467 type:complete len:102 (-) Transcript_28078:41-346(-)